MKFYFKFHVYLSPLIIAGYEIMTKTFKMGLEKVRRGPLNTRTSQSIFLFPNPYILEYSGMSL